MEAPIGTQQDVVGHDGEISVAEPISKSNAIAFKWAREALSANGADIGAATANAVEQIVEAIPESVETDRGL